MYAPIRPFKGTWQIFSGTFSPLARHFTCLVHDCVFTCIHTSTKTHSHTCICICICICLYVCIFAYVDVYLYVQYALYTYVYAIYKMYKLNFEYTSEFSQKKNCRAPSKNSKPSKRNTERKPVSNERKKRALHAQLSGGQKKKNKKKSLDRLLSKPPRWV